MDEELQNLLNLDLGLTATPEILFTKASNEQQAVPFTNTSNGFLLNLKAALPYEALTAVAQTALQGKRINISEGLFGQHVVIDACRLYSADGKLLIEAQFSGSFRGTVYFEGTPVYNDTLQQIELAGFDYNLETKNLLLKGARWLFDKLIVDEIKKRMVFDLKPIYKSAETKINETLNREWTKGIVAIGAVEEINLTTIETQANHLLLQLRCRGNLQVTVSLEILK